MPTVSVNGSHSIAPSKIVCIGRNYVAHIEELGNEIPDDMVVFNKPNSAISQTLHSILGEALHYEGELAFVVEAGKLAAVGFGLDLTKRNLQSKKGSPGSAPRLSMARRCSAILCPCRPTLKHCHCACA